MIFARGDQCPLCGVERTLSECIATSQFDPKRSFATTPDHGARLYLGVLTRTTPEASPLDSHSVSPALRAGRMDRSGRPQGDNDIVEQYKNPSKALPRAP